jgi:hypothetical protein
VDRRVRRLGHATEHLTNFREHSLPDLVVHRSSAGTVTNERGRKQDPGVRHPRKGTRSAVRPRRDTRSELCSVRGNEAGIDSHLDSQGPSRRWAMHTQAESKPYGFFERGRGRTAIRLPLTSGTRWSGSPTEVITIGTQCLTVPNFVPQLGHKRHQSVANVRARSSDELSTEARNWRGFDDYHLLWSRTTKEAPLWRVPQFVISRSSVQIRLVG